MFFCLFFYFSFIIQGTLLLVFVGGILSESFWGEVRTFLPIFLVWAFSLQLVTYAVWHSSTSCINNGVAASASYTHLAETHARRDCLSVAVEKSWTASIKNDCECDVKVLHTAAVDH